MGCADSFSRDRGRSTPAVSSSRSHSTTEYMLTCAIPMTRNNEGPDDKQHLDPFQFNLIVQLPGQTVRCTSYGYPRTLAYC